MKTLNINIVKKLFFIFLTTLFPAALCAQNTGLEGISSTAEGLGNYIPVVQALCFVIAATIGVAGSVYAYYRVQKGEEPQKYVMMTVGSAMMFVVTAIILPQFFGYQSSPSEGMIAQNTTGGSGGSSSDGGDQTTSAIDTEIPDINDPAWAEQSTAKDIMKQYASDDRGNISFDLLMFEYTGFTNQPFTKYHNINYGFLAEAENLLASCNYNFDEAYVKAVADYEFWARYQTENPDWTAPFMAHDYLVIAQNIQSMQFLATDVTWWKRTGNYEPAPQYWIDKFH